MRPISLLFLIILSLPAYGRGARNDSIPSPVFDNHPEYVRLYWTAWDQARKHIKYQEGLVQSPYMDEGLRDDVIWIWDSEFMVMYCKYAPKLYPGIETLNNFYYTLHEDCGSPLSIWHPDNPPFFAWVENDYYKFTDDTQHISDLLTKTRFLQRHYHFFNEMTPESGFKFKISNDGVRIHYKGIGYNWNCWQSGMDNTPRMRGMPMYWVDAMAQQALSALYISRLARRVGDKITEKEFSEEYRHLKDKLNKYYWDEQDGMYYDIREQDLSKTRILTPASFWVMLAEVPSKKQADAMVRFAMRPEKIGGDLPWATVARDDEQFDPTGGYWRGDIWLPTAYMGIKALEKYGYYDIANDSAEKIVDHMAKTYEQYEPHTIWECYSPTECKPGSNKKSKTGYSRADFCGWSALGPISLFIENILGFYDVDAASKTIRWNLHQTCRHGIERLSFGEITTDIIYENGTVTVNSNKPYVLVVNGRSHKIKSGETAFNVKL